MCKRELVLVMEYMPNRTLYDLPHSNPRPPSWAHWMRLALQTAKVLLTLHSTRPPVIHHDVKSTNILLDRNLDARLGNLGLALRHSSIPSSAAAASVASSTPPAGTLGYLDPSYVTPDSLNTKTDAFNFRILLLEIMSGHKAINVAHSPPSVVEWSSRFSTRGRSGHFLISASPHPGPCRAAPPREVVDQLKALSSLSWNSSRTLPSSAWNGLVIGNPYSVVDTQGGAISKLRPHGGLNSELRFINEDEIEEPEPSASAAAVDEEKENVEKTPIFAKKPPSTTAKGSHPSRNAKVFSEAGTGI
ncbi:Serine/threonine-protein kinase-like protein [Ananas comosus]|uniref:Serine/threonine-protein kinase-like protein n=1 Tax=Ananas comosus TaxID=4615 RepID=A0A199VCC3_ANACO|nr:Serine/threonine-protein kinase-like protein [Ananas comosus]